MKRCTRCKTLRKESDYHQCAARPGSKITHCKICEADKKLIKRYGITFKTYTEMLELQDYKCLICKRTEIQIGKRLSVDHCHETGKIRGLLCSKCNQAVGLLNDDPLLGDSLSRYLRSY